MDPELRAYLEAMEQRIDQRAAARDAETRTLLGAQIEGVRAEAATRDAETRSKIDEVRRQAGMDRDAIIREIKALPEAFSTHQRAEADRLDAAREEAMLNHHVLPLEAGASSQQERINDHEKRIRAVEKR